MLVLLRTPINPVTCRSSLLFYPGIIAHGRGLFIREVHANRDLAVKGTVVASPSQCLGKKIIFVINGMQQLNLDGDYLVKFHSPCGISYYIDMKANFTVHC
ncbi:hypothetical protein CDAR_195751 [Caerostris darwini]|uniref:Uncharacterized protein n=1 Tax=Caerostris darwini TaxID=1538125 RepID=A0AAV4RZ02_9ARAC|nr:hypothetical protein CDAR_195751 [Caerostris darwini]